MTGFPDDPQPPDAPTPQTQERLSRDQVVRQFVEHWGLMARSWGINSSMGELFALLYISGTDWTADDLREWLQVSRGNVSMNLRELIAWGVVHKVHRTGERREFFRAEDHVWILFRRILLERKRRELDPTLRLLRSTAEKLTDEPGRDPLGPRIKSLLDFFSLIDSLASRLMALDLAELRQLVGFTEEPPPVV